MDMDFGYSQSENTDNSVTDLNSNDGNGTTNLDTGKVDHSPIGVSADDISDISANNINKDDSNNTSEDQNDVDSKVSLEAGMSIEVGDETYTVDAKGNIIDKNGNIFKEASEADSWIKSFDQVDEGEESISISSIQDAVGVSITDDDGKDVEFENTPAGIKAYVDAVIETAKEEHFETAINTLYQRYPILNDVLNYYVANGNSLEGFGQITDRSNVTIDDTNEAQQENIIRIAWEEQNRKGDVNSYINYLKSSGILLATAKEELAGLQEADKQYRDQLAEEAERKENERIARLEQYWNDVHDVVKSRTIAGYQIPENIIINRNGQKLSVSPEDFFNYIYRVDQQGKSAYERDLAAQDPNSRRDDEILRAYLKFVGGNYSNLVDMAINKEKVNTLKLRAKERNTNTIRINKPKTNSANGANIDLGYN